MQKIMKLREIWLKEVVQSWMYGFWQYMKGALKVQYMRHAGIVLSSASDNCNIDVTNCTKLHMFVLC
jgi:hypothetical protein